jgi:gluconokinase
MQWVDMIAILMGVAGAGKTTVGRRLARELGWHFLDADDFHPPGNVRRMRAGIPLTDADREPWLAALEDRIRSLLLAGESAVIACSALKSAYRARLARPAGETGDDVRFVLLEIDPAEARRRIESRTGHFAPSSLVESQFLAFEPTGADVLTLDATRPPDSLVRQIHAAWNL